MQGEQNGRQITKKENKMEIVNNEYIKKIKVEKDV